MSKLTPQMVENAKQMIVNLEVAKTMDRKNQTRRLPKKKILDIVMSMSKIITFEGDISNQKMYEDEFIEKFTQYKVGDILWVREPAKIDMVTYGEMMDYHYLADYEKGSIKIPDRFLHIDEVDEADCISIKSKWIYNCQGIPNGCIKEMARIFLKVTNVRVERLQDITLEDIGKEGSPFDVRVVEDIGEDDFAYEWWIDTWNSTAPKGYKWGDNPYVFVYEFERVQNV